MHAFFKLLKSIDWTIIIAIMVLMTIGVLFIYSSGVTSEGVVVSREYQKQILWCITGILLLIASTTIDLKRLTDYLPIVYILSLLVLLYTTIFGKRVNGAQSWLGLIGGYGIQPSEFVKISTALFLARYLERSSHEGYAPKRFIIALIIVGLPMLLILSQPDFGTALVFVPMFIAMAFFGQLNRKYIAMCIGIGSIMIVMIIMPLWHKLHATESMLRILYEPPYIYYLLIALACAFALSLMGYIFFKKKYYYWICFVLLSIFCGLGLALVGRKVLKEYQLMRLMVFLDPSIDPRDSGWNILQSITAIGSGGLGGKGFLQGTQSHYRYLPQQSTDFIFSIISEELGFVGGIVIFSLYLYILIKLMLSIKGMASYQTSTFIAGLFGIIIFHFMINVGMAMGVMPITGIPLLFLSYGGSSLWAMCIGIGIALGANTRKYDA